MLVFLVQSLSVPLIEPTINVGNLLTFITCIALGAIGWGKVVKQLDSIEKWKVSQELRTEREGTDKREEAVVIAKLVTLIGEHEKRLDHKREEIDRLVEKGGLIDLIALKLKITIPK